MADLNAAFGDEPDLAEELKTCSADDLRQRVRLLDNDIRVMKSETQRLQHELATINEKTKDNKEKIKLNRQLPHLVANVAELLKPEDLAKADEEEGKKDVVMIDGKEVGKDGKEIGGERAGGEFKQGIKGQEGASSSSASGDNDSKKSKKKEKKRPGPGQDNEELDNDDEETSLVVKTTTRQTIFLPVIGLVDAEDLKPQDLIGVNKDSFLVLDKLPPEYDSRVKAMEVDEKPTDNYSDIGGLEKQIEELIEAIVLPMKHKDKFDAIGIKPPKGVLMHGPPGTGKTMMARACAANTNATFLKLAGPQLVQMYIGDGAKIVRDAFELAKEKAPTIIFIDEIDAVGMKRSGGGELSGVREVQRTMLELLNQLDGFSGNADVKVIAATNRPDVLDPALLRSGRLDRKIELPHPTEDGRARIMQIHSRRMNVNQDDVNFQELSRMCEDFNGAQCKAVCVEAGMEALRRGSTELCHEDYVVGLATVLAKKKSNLNYYA